MLQVSIDFSFIQVYKQIGRQWTDMVILWPPLNNLKTGTQVIKKHVFTCKSSKSHNYTRVSHALDATRSENFQVFFFTLTPKIWLILKPKCKCPVHLMWFYMFSLLLGSLQILYGCHSFGGNWSSKINVFCENSVMHHVT